MKSNTPLTHLVVVATAIAALTLTARLYQKPPLLPFPRLSRNFKPALELEAALASARAAVQQNPDNFAAWDEIALLSFQRGPAYYLEGLEALERARELGALDERLFYYGGVMYEAKGLLEYSVADYERFLRRHPDDNEVRARVGNLYYRLDETDKAIAHYQKALAVRPHDTVITFNLAMCYRDKSRWTEGIGLLKEYLQNGRALPAGGNKLLGDLYRGLGNYTQALSCYHQELLTGKDDPETTRALALTYEGLKDDGQALAQWKRATELNPKDREAQNRVRLLKKRLAKNQGLKTRKK